MSEEEGGTATPSSLHHHLLTYSRTHLTYFTAHSPAAEGAVRHPRVVGQQLKSFGQVVDVAAPVGHRLLSRRRAAPPQRLSELAVQIAILHTVGCIPMRRRLHPHVYRGLQTLSTVGCVCRAWLSS